MTPALVMMQSSGYLFDLFFGNIMWGLNPFLIPLQDHEMLPTVENASQLTISSL